jgi:hypothetical protein
MLRMCVYMHPRFVENHPIRILEDRPLISEGVLSQHTNNNFWYQLAKVDTKKLHFLYHLNGIGIAGRYQRWLTSRYQRRFL